MAARVPPIILEPVRPAKDIQNSAAFVFLHGLDDDGMGLKNIADQFQSLQKLPHMKWVLPNAMENRNAMQTAWYMPTALYAAPPSRPELVDDEDEDGMLQSSMYIETILDELVSQGVPAGRIVLGGFSQGQVMTLFTGLTSAKYSGKLAGLAAVCGYLPLPDKLAVLRHENGLPAKLPENTRVFVVRGGRDPLVPGRYFRQTVEKLRGEFGVQEDMIEAHEYEGMGHTITGRGLQDLCVWLETVLPPLE